LAVIILTLGYAVLNALWEGKDGLSLAERQDKDGGGKESAAVV